MKLVKLFGEFDPRGELIIEGEYPTTYPFSNKL